MNELLIKQLADRAREYADSLGLGGLYWQNAKLKKFAELVVKECINCSTWVGEVNKNPVEPIHTAHAINKRIKKHFGVEE
jgi:hypothetical protein